MNIPQIHVAMPDEHWRFTHSPDNRPILDEPSDNLKASIKKNQMRPELPAVVREVGDRYEILDGQNRFEVAQRDGLPFYYVVVSDEDAAKDWPHMTSEAVRKWHTCAYVGRAIAKGAGDYQEVVEFAAARNLPLSYALAIHAKSSYAKVRDDVCNGTYTITSRDEAARIADVYNELCNLREDQLRNPRFLEAVIHVVSVELFDPERMIRQASKSAGRFILHKSKSGYVKLLDEVYNQDKREAYLDILGIDKRKRVANPGGEKQLRGGVGQQIAPNQSRGSGISLPETKASF